MRELWGRDARIQFNCRSVPNYNPVESLPRPTRPPEASRLRSDPQREVVLASLLRYAGQTRFPGRTEQMTAPASVSMLLLRNVPLFSTLPEQQLALLTGVV